MFVYASGGKTIIKGKSKSFECWVLSLSWVWVSGKCFRGCSSEWWAKAGRGSWPPCPPGTMITLTSGHCVQVYQHCTAVWLFTARLGPGQDSVQRKASDSLHSAVSSGARCKVVSQCCALCTALLMWRITSYFNLGKVLPIHYQVCSE